MSSTGETKPNAILLDIMETVVAEPFLEVMPRYFNMSAQDFLTEKDPRSWIEFEHGNITEEQYFASFFSDRREIDGEGLKQAMHDAYEWLPGMEQLLSELKESGFPLFALSNYSIWYLMIEEKLKLSNYLNWDFVSCNTGHRKPDQEAYLGPTASLALKPEQILFIDDRPVNIDGAQKVGMQAHLFTSSDALETMLRHNKYLSE